MAIDGEARSEWTAGGALGEQTAVQGPYCPYYAAAVEMIGRRWVPLILRAMLSGTQRFSDIAAAIPDMTDAMLSRRLKDLEADGLIKRQVHASTPVRVEYL